MSMAGEPELSKEPTIGVGPPGAQVVDAGAADPDEVEEAVGLGCLGGIKSFERRLAEVGAPGLDLDGQDFADMSGGVPLLELLFVELFAALGYLGWVQDRHTHLVSPNRVGAVFRNCVELARYSWMTYWRFNADFQPAAFLSPPVLGLCPRLR